MGFGLGRALLSAAQRGEGVQDSLALAQRGLDGVDQALVGNSATSSLDHEAVDDDLDVVLALLVELDLFVEGADDAVDAGAGEAALSRVGQDLLVLALALLDERREQG